MRPVLRPITGLLGMLIIAACTIADTPQIEEHGGLTFTTQLLEERHPVDSSDYRYKITFPDGTTSYTQETSETSTARGQKDGAISWLLRNNRTPGRSNTVAGPPASPNDVPRATSTSVDPIATAFDGGD